MILPRHFNSPGIITWAYLGLLILLSMSITPVNLPAEDRPTSHTMVQDVLYRTDDGQLTDAMRARCRLDLYLPVGEKGFPTVVWFHGGGLRGGEKAIPEKLKNSGIAVAAANYRLYPAAKCPDYLDDAAAATAWVLQEIESYGGDPTLVFVSGHSAGGYLSAMVGLDRGLLEKHGASPDSLAGIVALTGHAITHFTIREERGIPGTQPIVDQYAPLYHVRADAPPLLLITGDRELEMLGRYEENAYLARMMKVAGHTRTRLLELDGFDHGTMEAPALDLLLREVRTTVSRRQPASP